MIAVILMGLGEQRGGLIKVICGWQATKESTIIFGGS